MKPSPWPEWVSEALGSVRAAGRWRETRTLDGGGPEFEMDGRPVVSFASNDYLGLSQHPRVVAGARDALERWGAGAGSARLIVGSRPVHAELEDALAQWKGEDAALVFPTGFSANLGVLSTFGAGARVVSDELNHASIVDGCRLARAAEVCVYAHGDVEEAASLLKGAPGRALLVSDAVFSMDGDLAPISDLAEICARHDALLVLDEAHAVLDADFGRDLAASGVDHLRIGTLSKTLGSLGGFVAGRRAYVDLLINRARPFIFTTAPTPADTGAALAALEVLASEEGDRLRDRLRANVERVAPGHPSPIVAVLLGEEEAAVAAADALLDAGLLVPAIRPPTVAPGTSRLRVALSALHSSEQLIRLVAGLAPYRA
ncbi:MAG: aminotransferase class I/II-fold pyridoxal phosphate-dependent enzyme [Acidimicrobiales bacterium]